MLGRRFLMSALLATSVCSIARGNSENGWSSNGGEYLFEADNAWNLGSDPVPYCVLVKPDYPLSLPTAKNMVSESLSLWRKFFEKYQLDTAAFGDARGNPRLIFPDRQVRGISLNFAEKECPAEDDRTTVRFLFGVENEVVNNYLEVASDGSLGVAMRRAYDHKSYRNGGYVWVANFSTDQNRIRHILLHEMGHILGMPHDSVFVMDEDVALSVKNAERFDSEDFGVIENSVWPYRLLPGESVLLSSRLGRRRETANPPSVSRCRALDALPTGSLPPPLRRAFGFEPGGCFRMSLQAGNQPDAVRAQDFRLAFSDEGGVQRGVLDGTMHSAVRRRLDFPSPGLATRWVNATTGATRYVRSLLDSVAPTAPARGSFLFQGRELAARMEVEKGIRLELFVGGKWWLLRPIDE